MRCICMFKTEVLRVLQATLVLLCLFLGTRIVLCCVATIAKYWFCYIFFFNYTATTEIYTLSLHDALPIFGFIDNRKPNFNYLVDDIAELLTGKYGVSSVIKRNKRATAMPAPDAVLKELTAQCDLVRSEEHTSELQSQSNLVCRLLLEKKKK